MSLGLGIGAIFVTKGKAPKRRGFGFAVTGTILSVLAIAGVFGTQSLYSSAIDSALDEMKSPKVSASESDSTASEDKDSKEAPTNSTKSKENDIQVSLDSLNTSVQDYEGKRAAILTYTVTNNSSKNYDIMFLSVDAFQNGTSLNNFVVFKDNPEGYDPQSAMQTVQPGATATVTEAFLLSDESSAVEIQLKDSLDFGNDEPLTKTFPLQ